MSNTPAPSCENCGAPMSVGNISGYDVWICVPCEDRFSAS